MDSKFEKPLRVAAKKHDLISIFISDPRESELPSVGLVELQDAETGRKILLDTSDRDAMAAYRESVEAHRTAQHLALTGMGVDLIDIHTDVPYDRPLLRFFEKRGRQLRR